jgi:DNA-directed RNA polymerase I, II, and III subunit RPABC2
MSDIEDYSSYSSSDESEDLKPTKKNIGKLKPNIDSYNDIEDDDSEINDDISEDDNIQDGGADEDVAFQSENDEPDIEESDDDIAVNDEDDIEEDNESNIKTSKQIKPTNIDINTNVIDDDDDDDDDDDYENYLHKFDNDLSKNYVKEFHPECYIHNYDEILNLTRVIRNEVNIIIDPLHRTIPYLTKYEKARVLGQRAKQIETGSKPFIKVPDNIIDSYVIAELELQEKKIPFIIKRPIPGGGFEYWNIKDLEIIYF